MEIWQEIKKDKENGARRLVAEYGNRIYAAALLLSSNDLDAEELTFKTLGRAVEKIHLFDPKRTFFTWLYAILLNFHRMERRKKHLPVIPMGATSDLPEVACDSFADVLDGAGGDDVTAAVRTLPPPLRETVVLRYYSEKSIEEISKILDIPTGTVKSRLHHARETLVIFSRKKEDNMNENELELLLSSKIKSCVDGKHLPDGFAERMVAEVRRAKRAFRFRVVTLSAVVIALSSILMGFLAELPRQETKEPSLIAVHEGGTKEKISGWVLLGFFKECFKRVRTNKRKEEY